MYFLQKPPVHHVGKKRLHRQLGTWPPLCTDEETTLKKWSYQPKETWLESKAFWGAQPYGGSEQPFEEDYTRRHALQERGSAT